MRAQLKAEPVDESELRIHLANLLMASGRVPEAEGEFARARAASPDSPMVKEWLARKALRENEREEAARLYREAIAAGSRNSIAYLISANLRMNDSRSAGADREGGGGPDLPESLAEIRQSIKLKPGNLDAYRALGRALFLSSSPTDAEVAELSRGIVPGTDQGQIQLYRALLHRRLKHEQEYLADLRQVIAQPSTSRSNKRYAEELLEGR